MNNGRVVLMQVVQALQNLLQPLLDDLQLRVADLLDVLPQRAACDHLGDDMDLVVLATYPGADEPYDVLVLELLDDVDFGLDARTIRFVQHAEVDRGPGHLASRVHVDTAVNILVGAAAEQLCEASESTTGRLRNSLLVAAILELGHGRLLIVKAALVDLVIILLLLPFDILLLRRLVARCHFLHLLYLLRVTWPHNGRLRIARSWLHSLLLRTGRLRVCIDGLDRLALGGRLALRLHLCYSSCSL